MSRLQALGTLGTLVLVLGGAGGLAAWRARQSPEPRAEAAPAPAPGPVEQVQAALARGEYAPAKAAVEAAPDQAPLVPELAALARTAPELVAQLRAEQLLFRIDSPAARAEHARLISDRSAPRRVRTQAIGSLSRRGDAGSARVLAGVLGDPDPGVRVAAARSLGMGGHEDALPALVDALAAEKDESVQRALVEGIARLDRPEGLEVLLDRLGSAARGSELEASLKRGISNQSNRASVSALLAAAARTSDPELLAAIYAALGTSGDASAADVLLRGAAGRSREARLEAVNALGLLREARAVKPFEKAIARADEEERRYLTTALERIRGDWVRAPD